MEFGSDLRLWGQCIFGWKNQNIIRNSSTNVKLLEMKKKKEEKSQVSLRISGVVFIRVDDET